MKKILLIFNETHSPESLTTFIKKNINTENILFQGLFIKRLHIDQAFTYPFPNDLSATAVDYTYETDADESLQLMKSYQQLFEDECKAQNIQFQSAFLASTSTGYLIELSAYADLILTDTQTEFNDKSLQDLLPKAHCPLLLVSAATTTLQNIILAFDGTTNSMYAIRNFGYLFTQWNHLPTHVVTVLPSDDEQPGQTALLKEWVAQHFSNVTLHVLHGKPKEELVTFINKTNDAVVVMGAFGRSAISRWANSSLAEVVAENTKAALFITHE